MRIKSFFIFGLVLFSCCTWADLLVIVNAQNPVSKLERKQVMDIFMGRAAAFPTQQPAHTLDTDNAENLRATFYKALTGKNEAQVDAYWATLIFAGRMSPPEKISSESAVINAVKRNPAAIGYITRQNLPGGVKVVLELPTTQ